MSLFRIRTRTSRRTGFVRRLVPVFCLLAIALAAASLIQFWREQSRPGMRHYLQGREYLAAGVPLQAEREWRLGTTEDPADYRCYKELGDYYAQLRQFPEARACYVSAARLAPRRWIVWLRLAAAERELGHGDAARAAALRAYRLRPDHADAVGLYGLLLADARNRPAAVAMLRRAHQLRPNDRQYFTPLVQTELDSMDFAAVERDLSPYLRAHPGDPDACFMMAVVYNQKPRTAPNLQSAIDLARRALAGKPRDARVYALLGQLYLDAGRTRDAVQVCTAGQRVAPHAEGILHCLIDADTRLGRTADAAAVSRTLRQVLARHDRVSYLTYAMSLDPHNIAAGLELAHLAEADGRYAPAQRFYEQLVRQAPDDPRLRRALSAFYRRMGRPDQARRALKREFTP